MLIQIVCTLLLVTTCRDTSKPNVTTLQVKSPTTGEKNMVLKSSYIHGKTLKLFSGGTVATHDVFVANYQLKTEDLPRRQVNQPQNDGEILIGFSLLGRSGSTAESPSIGTYSVKPEFGAASDPVMRIPPEDVVIVSRSAGVENRNSLNKPGLVGSVTIKSVNRKMVLGEINFTVGDTSIKGQFNSWILASPESH